MTSQTPSVRIQDDTETKSAEERMQAQVDLAHMGSCIILRRDIMNIVGDMRKEVMKTVEDMVAQNKKQREDTDMALMVGENWV